MQERMVMLLADSLVSPTEYMQSYLLQRGWQLPADSRIIPNIMPAFEEAKSQLPQGIAQYHSPYPSRGRHLFILCLRVVCSFCGGQPSFVIISHLCELSAMLKG